MRACVVAGLAATVAGCGSSQPATAATAIAGSRATALKRARRTIEAELKGG